MVMRYSREGVQGSEKLVESLKAQVSRESERIDFKRKELESVKIRLELGEYEIARDELRRKLQEVEDRVAQQELDIAKVNEMFEAEKAAGEEELKLLHSQV
jgi:hypothetical protein